ncbi:MAG: ASKHA domain-containing protein, partial [Bacteroidota bacterium]
GAFGNYINRSNAYRIGLLRVPPERIHPAGNTALLGAKIALFNNDEKLFSDVRQMAQHVSLNVDEQFQDIFVDEMNFPSTIRV